MVSQGKPLVDLHGSRSEEIPPAPSQFVRPCTSFYPGSVRQQFAPQLKNPLPLHISSQTGRDRTIMLVGVCVASFRKSVGMENGAIMCTSNGSTYCWQFTLLAGRTNRLGQHAQSCWHSGPRGTTSCQQVPK